VAFHVNLRLRAQFQRFREKVELGIGAVGDDGISRLEQDGIVRGELGEARLAQGDRSLHANGEGPVVGGRQFSLDGSLFGFARRRAGKAPGALVELQAPVLQLQQRPHAGLSAAGKIVGCTGCYSQIRMFCFSKAGDIARRGIGGHLPGQGDDALRIARGGKMIGRIDRGRWGFDG